MSEPARATRVPPLALPALVAGGIIIGFSPILMRFSEIGPTATAFHRIFLALPILFAWMAVERRRRANSARIPVSLGEILLAALPGLFFAGDLVFWHWAIALTSVANGTLLANMAPLLVTIGAWVLFGERVGLRFMIGMAAAVGGAVLLVGGSASQGTPGNLRGDGFALSAVVFYAGYILSLARLRSRFTTASIMAWSSVSAAAALLVITLILGESFWPGSMAGWLVLLTLSWIGHIGGQSLITFALAHLPASFGSVTLLLQPAVAAALAWVLLNEPLGPWQMAGAVFILTGIVQAQRGSSGP
jgi:drug/metabolite transporter (DMT)-like permease